MSDMEYNKGTLIPCSWEEVKSEFPDATIDDLEYETKGRFVALLDHLFFRVVWEVRRGDLLEGLNHLKLRGNRVGYDFETYHYNGGAHWTELVEYNLLKEEEKSQ